MCLLKNQTGVNAIAIRQNFFININIKKIFFFIVSVAITFTAQAQNNNKIVIGKVDSVYSKILNEQRMMQ